MFVWAAGAVAEPGELRRRKLVIIIIIIDINTNDGTGACTSHAGAAVTSTTALILKESLPHDLWGAECPG